MAATLTRNWRTGLLALGIAVPLPSLGVLFSMVLAPGPVAAAVWTASKVAFFGLPLFWRLRIDREKASLSPLRKGGLGAGLWTGLLLGAAMTQWPYTHGCGLPLGAYLGGVLVVLVAALWSTVSSWQTRSALAHALSLGLFVWGGFLAAREVLPRIGYAKETAEWACQAPRSQEPRAESR